MPSLGADMEAGTLVAWRRKPGDRLQRGDIIAEVETDKGIIEVEVFADGVIERLLAEPGQKVPVGTPLAMIAEAPGQAQATAPASTTPPPAESRPRMSPAARRRALELGIDARAPSGTGPHGTVTLQDVERAATAAAGENAAKPEPALATAEPEREPERAAPERQQALRRAIAAAMSRAKREIPHYYLSTTIDLGTAMAWLSARNASRGIDQRLLPGTLLLKAAALAAKRTPELNAHWQDDRSQAREHVHLGVAVALRGGGLIAPAIHDADQLELDTLMARLQDLVARARAGSLRSSELSDGTITVTSLGERGAESVLPIIYPPQVAIVGFGRIVERPWVLQGALAVRPIVTATLAADHRASDGHLGSRFLAAIDRLLQEPEQL